MSQPKIEERTLYPPIVNYLKEIGFQAFGESKVTTKHPDIIFRYGSISFVVEIKIGKPVVGSKAVAQAYDYATKLGTNNIIILIYPEEIRNQVISTPNIVTNIALDQKIHTIVLTEYLTESTKNNPRTLFNLHRFDVFLNLSISLNGIKTSYAVYK